MKKTHRGITIEFFNQKFRDGHKVRAGFGNNRTRWHAIPELALREVKQMIDRALDKKGN